MPNDDNDQTSEAFYGGAAARGPGGTSDTAELRGECPRQILDVLDAVSMARNITRTKLVNEILGEYTDKKLHESSLVLKLTRGNPTAPETGGKVAA